MEVLKTKNNEKKDKKIITRSESSEKKESDVKNEEIVCPICGSREIIKDYERAEIICAKCGCVIKEKLFDIGPEWRAFDHEQKIKRCRVGAPMTYSVDYNEPIIIKENGKIKVIKIGELIDSVIENTENVRKEGILEIARCNNIEVISFNGDYKLRFTPVSEVSRHPVQEMYEIVVEGNKSVKVTGSHSVFTLKGERVTPTRVDELKVGDILVLARRLPNFEDRGLEDKDLAKILGYLISDGYYDKEKAVFYIKKDDDNAIRGVLNYFKNIGSCLKITEMKDVIEIEVKDSKFINRLYNLGVINKRVPYLIYHSPRLVKKQFIEGLFNDADRTTIIQRELAEDVVFLLLQIGEDISIHRRVIKGREVYEICRRINNNFDYINSISRNLISSDFIFLKIKSIKKTKPTSKYAYDLTVPNAENFIAGFGGFVLHNTIHDKGLSTVIDWRNKDSYGKDISANKRAQLYRLRKWQRRIRVSDAAERNLAFALSELDRITSKLGLPRHVRENAAIIYRNAVEKGLIRGRSIEGVVAAAIYAACRRCRVPRTLDEIAEASRVDRKEIGRTYRFLARELNIKLTPTNPIDYVPRFASELGLPGEVESKAIQILQQASEKGLTSGRGPTGVAAAAIYIASVLLGCRRTQREVAEVAGVTEVTIRNRYKELTEHLDIDVTL